MNNKKETLTLLPSWKNYFWLIAAGILLSPALIGVIILWLVYSKRKTTKFIISDNSIAVKSKTEQKEVHLADINSTEIKRSNWQNVLGIGDIHLQANVSEIVLEGISDPKSLLDKIDTAIAYQKELLNQKKSLRREEPKYDPGSMDKLDQLTGMWQQGLISDEDFDEERKKFE